MSDAATPVLQSTAFAQAKARFSELMDQAVHQHRVQLIDRHRGKEQAVLVSLADLGVLLEGLEFHPRVSAVDGEFVIRVPELKQVAGGGTLDEALDELIDLVEDQAQDFLDRLDFYLQTDRRRELPWVLKFAITDPAERRKLFVPPTPGPRAGAPAPA